MNLPDGFDTNIGDNGMLLSGGEKQRIAIARALLKQSSILIFDEATSALDNESEKEIQNAIEKASKNKTTFIIAHRLSTVEKADKICVLEEGTITQIGTHDELIKEEGLYNVLQGSPVVEEVKQEVIEEDTFIPTKIPDEISYWDRYGFVNLALLPVSFFYWIGSSLKNLFRKPKRSNSNEIPVIVVGNLTVGGNGKTPLVNQIASDLLNLGYQPGIILRGYGGKFIGTKLVDDLTTAKEVGDEALFHFNRGFTVVVDRDRARALSFLERNTECDIVVSDDGLQHSNLRRDFEIVVEDSKRNFGNKLFLPSGPLRDNLAKLKNIDLFMHSGRAIASSNFFELEPDSWVHLASGKAPTRRIPIWQSGQRRLRDSKPCQIFETLNGLKINFEHRAFKDHHYFSKKI